MSQHFYMYHFADSGLYQLYFQGCVWWWTDFEEDFTFVSSCWDFLCCTIGEDHTSAAIQRISILEHFSSDSLHLDLHWKPLWKLLSDFTGRNYSQKPLCHSTSDILAYVSLHMFHRKTLHWKWYFASYCTMCEDTLHLQYGISGFHFEMNILSLYCFIKRRTFYMNLLGSKLAYETLDWRVPYFSIQKLQHQTSDDFETAYRSLHGDFDASRQTCLM